MRIVASFASNNPHSKKNYSLPQAKMLLHTSPYHALEVCMFLTLDIGNTNITAGLYDGESLGPRWRLATRHHRTADEYGIYLVQLLTYP